ncbi:hypothetical protein T484DRAFT_1880207 [Baffinella frigidus]|nr:hypothetical protein T484DRAFT_1880207 [Cryptophyta sp. CCMP2293]
MEILGGWAFLKSEGEGFALKTSAEEEEAAREDHHVMKTHQAHDATQASAEEEEEEEEARKEHHGEGGAGAGEGHAGAGEGHAAKKMTLLDEFGDPIPAMAKFGYQGGRDAPFPPDSTMELSFAQGDILQGDILQVLDERPDGWCLAKFRKRTGFVPGNYLRYLTESELAKAAFTKQIAVKQGAERIAKLLEKQNARFSPRR